MDDTARNQIKRKPLPYRPALSSSDVSDILDDYYFGDEPGTERPLSAKTEDCLPQKREEPLTEKTSDVLAEKTENSLSLNEKTDNPLQEKAGNSPTEKTKDLSLCTRPSLPRRPYTTPAVDPASVAPISTSVATWYPTEPAAAETSSKSIWKTAFDETVHFAGGLLSHPFESTKHFSVLRHSPGLVFYRGPSTSVTVSIFGDEPLPPDRSLWLQRKGFSGNLGMNASALFRASSGWIDVTPATESLPSNVPESDERAWQRDMKKFTKNAAKHRTLSKHTPLETCVVRIPAIAEDGYLRIVICTGAERKKVLCPSPVFRIASTSSDVSILRGASLSTMPLEAGLKAASVIGTTVMDRYVGPARTLVQTRVQKYATKLPSAPVSAETVKYARTGVHGKLQSLEEYYNGTGGVSYDPLHAPVEFDDPPEIVGLDSGPELPFPIRLDGKVVRGTGQGLVQTGTPTANLSGIGEDLLQRLNGIYIGWASVRPRKGLEDVSHDWHEAIITIGPSPYAAARVVSQNVATVHLIHDFGSSTFFDAKLEVVTMAYLRPLPKPDRARPPTGVAEAVAKDVDVALASLSREHWGPEVTIQRMETERGGRTFSDKYVDARVQAQRRVDSVPVHWAGIRVPVAEQRDQMYGNGGFWIRR